MSPFDWILAWWRSFFQPDPLRHCTFHRDMGCCHVDSPGCDMGTCPILKDYREFCGDE